MLPPASAAQLEACCQICSERCWPERIIPSCSSTDLQESEPFQKSQVLVLKGSD